MVTKDMSDLFRKHGGLFSCRDDVVAAINSDEEVDAEEVKKKTGFNLTKEAVEDIRAFDEAAARGIIGHHLRGGTHYWFRKNNPEWMDIFTLSFKLPMNFEIAIKKVDKSTLGTAGVEDRQRTAAILAQRIGDFLFEWVLDTDRNNVSEEEMASHISHLCIDHGFISVPVFFKDKLIQSVKSCGMEFIPLTPSKMKTVECPICEELIETDETDAVQCPSCKQKFFTQ